MPGGLVLPGIARQVLTAHGIVPKMASPVIQSRYLKPQNQPNLLPLHSRHMQQPPRLSSRMEIAPPATPSRCPKPQNQPNLLPLHNQHMQQPQRLSLRMEIAPPAAPRSYQKPPNQPNLLQHNGRMQQHTRLPERRKWQLTQHGIAGRGLATNGSVPEAAFTGILNNQSTQRPPMPNTMRRLPAEGHNYQVTLYA